MFKWSRRRELTEQLAQQQNEERAARDEVGRLYAELTGLFRDLPNITGPRVIAGIGPKGGSGKTTAMVAVSYLLSHVVTGDLILTDVNPDKSNVRERLVRAGQRGTLLELVGALGTLHYPSQLARFQVPVGRVKLIHKDGLRSSDVAQVSSNQWYDLLETLSWYGQLVVADGGLSLVSPAAVGTLARADHVVLCIEGDPVVLQKTLEAVNEVVAGDSSMERLMLGATVVVAYTNPSAGMDPLLAEGIEFLQRTFAGVFVVPYDPAAAVSGLVPFDRLAIATQDVYLRIALHLAESFHRPSRATTPPVVRIAVADEPTLDDAGAGHDAIADTPARPEVSSSPVVVLNQELRPRHAPEPTKQSIGAGAQIYATGSTVGSPLR